MDVVLDCLRGEFVDASLRLLAAGGRFVEMGKTDIRDPAQVAAAAGHPVSYQAFDLMDAGPERIGQILAELGGLFASGVLSALPRTVFDVRQARAALRWMSQAGHTGKIVLSIPRPLDPEGSVLVTGGTGTLGGADRPPPGRRPPRPSPDPGLTPRPARPRRRARWPRAWPGWAPTSR